MDPLYWRLYYPDDTFIDEPLSNASIKLARPGAIILAACRPLTGPQGQDLRKPIVRVDLFDSTEVDGRLFKPVWYRKRSIGVFSGKRELPRLDLTIFGRAREETHEINSTLWASPDDGTTVIDCPGEAIDMRAIESLVVA